MKNIHIKSTSEASRFFITNEGKYGLRKHFVSDEMQVEKNMVMYITNNEYVGLSYYLDGDLVRKGVVDDKDYWNARKDYKKIIFTTDRRLIADGVKAVPDYFLEWFCDNSNCENIEITKEYRDIIGNWYKYQDDYKFTNLPIRNKIIIPSEKQDIDTCVNFDIEVGCRLLDCRCEKDKILSDAKKRAELEVFDNAKDLAYYKNNAEEDYLQVPISVLRYISELEKEVENKYTEENMIESSRYGYNFHKTTSFPEQEFEKSCINNTKQWLTKFKKKQDEQ